MTVGKRNYQILGWPIHADDQRPACLFSLVGNATVVGSFLAETPLPLLAVLSHCYSRAMGFDASLDLELLQFTVGDISTRVERTGKPKIEIYDRKFSPALGCFRSEGLGTWHFHALLRDLAPHEMPLGLSLQVLP